jgi:hypothetical protein
MSDCCTIQGVKLTQSRGAGSCPRCGERGKSVDIVTLKSLLDSSAMKRLEPSVAYHFCRVADCPVVYFNGIDVFTQGELTVRVYQKETSDPLPVCYCFGFTREQIFDEVARTGKSTAVQEITQYVKDEKCACELRNPQGSCCLGNVGQVVKQALGQKHSLR